MIQPPIERETPQWTALIVWACLHVNDLMERGLLESTHVEIQPEQCWATLKMLVVTDGVTEPSASQTIPAALQIVGRLGLQAADRPVVETLLRSVRLEWPDDEAA